MHYRNVRAWWRVITFALTVGAAVAEVIAEGRRRRKHADTHDQMSNWENEGGAPPPVPAHEA